MIRNFDLTEFKSHTHFPLHIGTLILNTDFEVHTHSFIELVIILRGHGIHVVGGDEFELHQGDVFVINGYLTHGFKNNQDLYICNFMFDMRIFQPFLSEFKKLAGFQSLFILEPYYRKQHEFKSRLILDQEGLVYVKSVISMALSEFNENRLENGFILKMYFFSLVAYLSKMNIGERNSCTRDLFFLAEAVSYMENNYTLPIRLKELANRAMLSERHFSRIFTKNYHVPPMEYIKKLRLQHAQKLLESQDLSVSEIAYKSGFYDTSAFSRIFKENLGISPSKYRNQVNNLYSL